MASFSLKCHLCGTYLTEGSPIWNISTRKRIPYHCLDRKCNSIRIYSRCSFEIIMPDEEIVSYQVVFQDNEKWYRIWGISNSEYPNYTALFSIDASGKEKLMIEVPKLYQLNVKDDIKKEAVRIFNKLKGLVVFS